MSVLHPGIAVAALAAVAVPILIHLLLRRRKRIIHWAAMDLLQRALQRDRRRQRIERWLLLVLRCLLVAVGGLALAQPLLGARGGATGSVRTLWLVIDDGVASAEKLPQGGTSLGRSVAEARKIVESLEASDRVGVITAAAPVRRLVDPPTADKSRLDALLLQMVPSDAGSDIAGAIRQAQESARETDAAGEIVLLGGWRRGSLDPTTPAPALDPALATKWRFSALPPLTGSSPNAWISLVDPVRRGEDSALDDHRTVRVRIDRRSDELPRSVRRVTGSGALAGAADLRLEAGERRGSADVRLKRSGAMTTEAMGEIGVSFDLDEDSQPRDDRFFGVLPSEQIARVVVLERRSGAARDLERLGPGVWMARALSPGRGATLQVDEVDPGSLDRAVLKGADAAIAARPDLISEEGWRILREFVASGATLVVAPSPDDAGQRWTERFRTSIAPSWRIDPEVEVSKSAWRLAPQQPTSSTLRLLGSEISVLAAPVTATRRMRIAAPAADAEAALLFDDAEPMLLCGRPTGAAKGWVSLLASSPELSWTDLPVRPLMVPLMQELVRQGRSLASADAATLVGETAALPRGAASLRVLPRPGAEGASRGTTIIPAGDGQRTRDPVFSPGLHEALDESGRVIGAVAVNVDPARTNIEPNDSGAVLAWLERSGPWRWMGAETAAQEHRTTLGDDASKWSLILLGAAILVALAETVLARLLSRADVAESIG